MSRHSAMVDRDLDRQFLRTDELAETCQYQVQPSSAVTFPAIWTEEAAQEEERDHGRVWVRRATCQVKTATIPAPSRVADWSRAADPLTLWNLDGIEDQTGTTIIRLIREERIDTSARKERTR